MVSGLFSSIFPARLAPLVAAFALIAPPAFAQAPVPAPAPAPAEVATPTLGEGVAIQVNSEPVSSYDVYQRVLWLLYWSKLRPTKAVLLRVEDEARRMLVDEALQLSELRRIAARSGNSFVFGDGDVERRIDVMARQRGMAGPGLLSELVDKGIDSETVYDMVRAQMSWDSYIQVKYSGKIWVDPALVSSRLATQSDYTRHDMYRVREIVLLGADQGRQEGGREFAEAIWREIVSNRISVAEVAEQFSQSASASKGGDIGWVRLGDLPQAARPVVSKMGPAQLSSPIEAEGRFIIYFIEDMSPAGGKLRYDVRVVFADSASLAEDQVGMLHRLGQLHRETRSCADVDKAQATYPDLKFDTVKGTDPSSIVEEFRAWLMDSQEGQSSAITATRIGAGFLTVCRKYREAPRIDSEDDIKEQIYVSRLVNFSKSELSRLRQSALISQRY